MGNGITESMQFDERGRVNGRLAQGTYHLSGVATPMIAT